MNDTELDDILNTWTAPEPPPSLRGRIRAGYAALAPRPRRRFRLAYWASVFGLAAFLLVLTAAFPQTARFVAPVPKIPFTVDSDMKTYEPDGTLNREIEMTTYMRNGSEIILSQSIPGHPLMTLAGAIINGAYDLWSEVISPLFGKSRQEPNPQLRAALVASGCVSGNATVLGHETILGYSTTIIQTTVSHGIRSTQWMAPDLGCYVLKGIYERERPDGTYRPWSDRHAFKVTVNP
ncbi:MAG TPA: hypothetical protein VKB88_31930 [Bryobacteraceae bacterium]|nr:hypothetical protein [Bryobacteraceae bacterium]